MLSGTSVSVSGVTTLSVAVGSGGLAVTPSGTNYAVGLAGSNSSLTKNSGAGSFTTVSAVGGGGGGAGGVGLQNGGSGGGAQSATVSSGTAGQGNAGGQGSQGGGIYWSGGGGGKAAVGSDGTNTKGGNGGAGSVWISTFTTTVATALSLAQTGQISGDQVYFAGGGGGSITGGVSPVGGSGGLGGGGDAKVGVNVAGIAGTANSGGGGGGTGCCEPINYSGAGGSGVIILKYLTVVTVTATGTNPSVCDQFVSDATGVTAERIANGDCLVKFASALTITWKVPEGVTSARTLIVGGGGGGGGGGTSTENLCATQGVSRNGGGGGGGAGGQIKDGVALSGISGSLSIIVGSAGSAGAAATCGNAGTSGGTGGTSSITSGVTQLVSAEGGGGGGGGTLDGAGGTGGNSKDSSGNITTGSARLSTGNCFSAAATGCYAGGAGASSLGNGNAIVSSGTNGTNTNGGAGRAGITVSALISDTLGGGGGGGNRNVASGPAGTTRTAGAGGAGGGGAGNAALDGSPGTKSGAGGGGGRGNGAFNANTANSTNGGAGYQGFIALLFTVNVTATFNSNYGSATTATQLVPKGTATSLTANSFSRDGYTFIGWNTSADGTGTWQTNSATVTISTDTTYYAMWSGIHTTGLVVNMDATKTPSLASGAATSWKSMAPGNSSLTSTTLSATPSSNTQPRSVDFVNSSYVDMGKANVSNFTGDITVETWVNFTTYKAGAVWNILATRWFTDATNGVSANDWHFGIYNNKLNFYTTGTVSPGYSGSRTFSTADQGKWFHLAVTQDTSGNMQFYINGVKDGTLLTSTPVHAGSDTAILQLGDGRAGVAAFNGKMSQFRLYNSALTSDQMIKNFNNDATFYSLMPLTTVSFNNNGGTGTMSAQSASVATSLTSNAFTRTGYRFNKWNTAANGGGTDYADAASYAFTADATLYAQWTAITPAAAFYADDYTAGSTTWTDRIASATGTAPTGGMTKTTNPTAVTFAGKEASNSDRLSGSIGSTSSTTSVSVEMWLKLIDSGSAQNAAGSMLFSWVNTPGAGNYNIYHYGNKVGFNTFNAEVYGINSTSLEGSWKHFVFVMTNTGVDGTQKIYVDGVNQSLGFVFGSSSLTRTFNASGNFLLMDNSYSSNVWNAKGSMGLTRIYKEELTAGHIADLYNATKSTYQLTAGLTPTFGTPTATSDGFTVQISNYDAAYSWAGTATASGSVAISGSGLVTVTGVAAGTSSTATITTVRTGYEDASATVTATSTANYIVTFDATTNGGTAISPLTASFTAGGTALVLPTPAARTGYAQSGWYTTASVGGSKIADAGGNYTPTGTGTIYFRWSANTYTITYKAGTGGSGTDLTQTFVYGNTATLKDATAALTKTGYAISGWSTTNGGTKTNDLSASYSAAADLILYPVWSTNTYTITYKAGTGGSGSDLTQTFVYGNTATLKDATAALTKTGYAISGWSTSDGGAKTNDLSAAYSSASNLTLYPVWSANTYTITYKAGPDGTGTDLTQTFVFGNTATLKDATAALTRSGYSISGWTTGSTTGASKTNDLSSSYSTAANLTLYPVWGPITYTITYKAGTGGSGSDLTQTFIYGNTATLKDATAALTKTGHAIGGWSTTDGGTQSYALSGSYSAAANINLYPVWAVNTYTITYKKGANGTGTDVVQSFTYGATATLGGATTALIRVGYSITGWATTDGGAKTNDLSSSYSSAANLILYPVWGANTYTVTYDATTNGGTALSPDTSTFTVAGSALTLKTPSARTGYTASGWYDAPSGGTKIGNAGAGGYSPTSDITLYFQWTPIAYTVTYAGNSNSGGSVPTNASTYNIGNSVTVAGNPNSLVRTGYSFAGWTDNSSGTGTVYTSGTGYTVGSANITFYAKWTANTYTVTFNANGALGEASATSDTYTTGGTAITFPTVGTLAKTGYNFAGWSATPTGTLLSGTYTTSVDVMLYAKWTIKTISVTYDKGAATGASIASWPSNDSGNYNSAITLGTPTSQVTIGGGTYQFSSWKVSGGTATYEAGSSYTLPATNPTLVAQWVQVFEVNYTFNGGTSATGFNYDAQCDPSTYLCLNNQQIQADAAPTRAGYTFTGWRDQSGNPIAAGATFTVTLNRYLLSAQWTAIDYTINYAPAGGVTTPTQAPKQYLQTFTVANDPVRTGYTFGGWSDGTLTYGAGATYTVGTSNITLTAQWTANVYTISYDWNGGSGNTTSASSYTVGNSAVTLPLVTGHTKDGYDFAGWSTTYNGTSVGTSYTPTQSLTLFAVWTPGTYTITYDGNGGTAASSTATIANGSPITLVNATRTSYVFDGWYSASSGGSLIGASGATFTPTLSRTLYARWTQLSLSGIDASALTYIGTLSASSSVTGSFSGSSAGSSVSVSVPAGSLPAGTSVNLHLVGDFSRAQSVISNSNNYVVSMVVSWVAADGTVPNTASGKPVTVIITNATIKRGMKVYGIAGPTVEILGTATVDGSITVELTKDPEVVVAATKPGAPTAVTATSGADASSVISWTAPTSDGGSAITGYTATSSGGQTCSTSGTTTCSITGLTNGTPFTFTVKALNAIGLSDASSASSAATPAGATTDSGGSSGGSSGGRVNTPDTDSNKGKPVITVEKKSEKTTLTWSGNSPIAVTIESSKGTKKTETVIGNTFALPVPKPGEGYKVSADGSLNNGQVFKDFIVAEPPTKPVTLNVAPNKLSQNTSVVKATWKATSSYEKFSIKITPTTGASKTIVTSKPSTLINLVPGKKYTITVTAIGYGDLKSKVLTKVVTAPKKRQKVVSNPFGLITYSTNLSPCAHSGHSQKHS